MLNRWMSGWRFLHPFLRWKRLPVLRTVLKTWEKLCSSYWIKTFALLFAVGFGLSVAMSACTPGGSTNLPSSSASNSNPAQSKAIRIGYQKYGTLILLKARGNLEERLKSDGVSVQWTQFPGGPQLLEALNAGSLDYGATGEAPPIFAQAAGAPLVYVANELPDPKGEAILVPQNSSIQNVSGLKGKKVALNKGSNVHYLLLQALTAAGLKYGDIKPVYLPPSDARAAFAQGSVDAWVIWDPYLTAAKRALNARILKNGEGLAANRQFYLATKLFAEQYPARVKAIIAETQKADDWIKAHPTEAANLVSPQLGIDVATMTEILQHQPYQVQPIQPEVVTYQQQIADAFLKQKLIPKQINVKEAVKEIALTPKS